MQGLVFQYGTAAHLAILTVAPLFLFAFCSPLNQAGALIGLSAFAAMWVVANPSPRTGEWPRDARHRIGIELVRDPFLTWCGIALALAAVRAANGGVRMDYDVASRLWCMEGPFVSILPGSVSGYGLLPLAGLLGLTVVTLGVRHALGRRARFAYLLISSILAAAAVVFWWRLSVRGELSDLTFRPDRPFGPGTLLGTFLLFAFAAWGECWRFSSIFPEIVIGLVISVLLLGLIFFAPLHAVYVSGVGVLLLFLSNVVFLGLRRPLAKWFGTAVALSLVLAPAALIVPNWLSGHPLWPVFAESFLTVRDTACDIAIRAWKASARLGAGLGAYPIALGFFAQPEDWQIVTDAQAAAPNGWIHFLFERGILGCVVALAGLGVLIRDSLRRFIRAERGWSFAATHFLGPIVLLSVVALLFVDATYVQVWSLMPVGAALALTAVSFPDRTEEGHGK